MTAFVARKIIAIIGILGLSACALESIPRATIQNLSPGAERIVFRAPAFSGAVHSMRFADFWEEEEYALFQGAGAQAEILYASVSGYDQLALEYGFTVVRSVETWTFNKRFSKAWGEVQRIRTPVTEFFYRPYRLAGQNRQCFGFPGSGRIRRMIPKLVPGKVMFGYYCGREGEAMDVAYMERLLLGITIRSERHDTPGEPRLPVLAREAALGARTGNSDFPFRFAQHYQTSDGNILD